MTNSNKMLKAKEVADRLSISKQWVYNRIKDGTIPSIKVGVRAVRVSEQALESWIKRRPHMPSRVRS